jgi:hypothetical protein
LIRRAAGNYFAGQVNGKEIAFRYGQACIAAKGSRPEMKMISASAVNVRKTLLLRN